MALLTAPFSPADGVNDVDDPALELQGANDLEVINTPAGTFVYLPGEDDDGLSVFRVNPDGTLTNVQNFAHRFANGTGLPLERIGTVTSATVGGRTFLYVEARLGGVFP